MKVLVDTCIWSLALRHESSDPAIAKVLQDLVNDA